MKVKIGKKRRKFCKKKNVQNFVHVKRRIIEQI